MLPTEDEKPMSPLLRLLDTVWKHTPHKSWRVINEAMGVALMNAVRTGMAFEASDITEIIDRFRGRYWMGDPEYLYSQACAGPHGPNPSAIKALERWLKRKPFICPAGPSGRPLLRLHCGARFGWHDDFKTAVQVKVTSFSRQGESPCVITCSHLEIEPGKSAITRTKATRIFRITHADIAVYRRFIREAAKARAEQVPLDMADPANMSPAGRVLYFRRIVREKREEARRAAATKPE
jgi:hypothetical protein